MCINILWRHCCVHGHFVNALLCVSTFCKRLHCVYPPFLKASLCVSTFCKGFIVCINILKRRHCVYQHCLLACTFSGRVYFFVIYSHSREFFVVVSILMIVYYPCIYVHSLTWINYLSKVKKKSTFCKGVVVWINLW